MCPEVLLWGRHSSLPNYLFVADRIRCVNAIHADLTKPGSEKLNVTVQRDRSSMPEEEEKQTTKTFTLGFPCVFGSSWIIPHAN